MIEEYKNKIINADCLDILKQFPTKSIDLVLTDPPYGININKILGDKHNGYREYPDKEWDKNIPPKEYFDGIKRVSKNQIIWGGNYFTDYLNPSQCYLIWDKGQRDFSLADGEMAWTSFDKAMRIFTYARGKCLSENGLHITQKPVKLFEWCLKNYSLEGQTILDPFSGSGTTAIACHNLKRNFICIEKDPEYHRKSVERYNKHILQERMF